jgi:hypothetical protein
MAELCDDELMNYTELSHNMAPDSLFILTGKVRAYIVSDG